MSNTAKFWIPASIIAFLAVVNMILTVTVSWWSP